VPRFDAAAAAAGGKIYIFGGLDDAGDLVGVVEEYDPATNTCKPLSGAMLTPRHDLAAVTGSNGRIYLIGGMRHCSATDIVEEFDPATKKWRAMTPMPTARYLAGAAATADGRIFVLGGWQKISGTATATGVIEEGTLPTA
jgi:kelch-like protein 29